jgi:hypothetical protein
MDNMDNFVVPESAYDVGALRLMDDDATTDSADAGGELNEYPMTLFRGRAGGVAPAIGTLPYQGIDQLDYIGEWSGEDELEIGNFGFYRQWQLNDEDLELYGRDGYVPIVAFPGVPEVEGVDECPEYYHYLTLVHEFLGDANFEISIYYFNETLRVHVFHIIIVDELGEITDRFILHGHAGEVQYADGQ